MKFLLCSLVLLLSVGYSPFHLKYKPLNLVELKKYEQSIHSQNGEDGVIEKICECIGAPSQFFVDLGAGDGYFMSNTWHLREKGWKGLLLDAENENHSINLHKEWITAVNVNSLLQKYHVPYEFDLLSIDLHSNDFYIWQAMSEHYRPRMIVVNYNANFSSDEDKVVIYDPHRKWDYTNYYGASALALFHLAREKGYSLVFADSWGVSLFFVRDDLIENSFWRFKNRNDLSKLHVQMTWHRQDPFSRSYVSSFELLQ